MLTDVQVPSVGESITSVFIATWLKQPGDAVAVGDPILEIDSDKASLEVPSPVAGVLREQLAAEGDEVNIGAVIARVEEGAVSDGPSAAAPAAASDDALDRGGVTPEADGASTPQPQPADGSARASGASGPAARNLAARKGVDIAGVTGSGTRGRVLSQDVAAATAAKAAPAPAAAPAAPAAARPAVPEGERVTRVAMTPMRRTIARRLVESKQTTAMLTTFNEVDLTAVKALRKQYQEDFVKRHGIKLGFMSFFIKASIEALKEYPAVNAEIDGTDILYKNYYNIGVAVSTPKGLAVPVIRDADQLTFSGIEGAIGDLGGRAREGKLRLADFQDGTFTISNGGVFGSMMSTPILNPPQVGILGMHAIQDRPMGINGQIVLRPMMYLALSYDHRIIDGKEAVTFLKRIKDLVEAPERLLLEV